MKLKHVKNEGYFKHLANAIVFAVLSVIAGIVIFIHAIIPALFQTLGSRILTFIITKNISRSNSVDHIQIRYNTRSKNEEFPWRVIVNGKETLAQDIVIIGNSFGEKSYVDGVAKYNMAVYGKAVWKDGLATIISEGRKNV